MQRLMDNIGSFDIALILLMEQFLQRLLYIANKRLSMQRYQYQKILQLTALYDMFFLSVLTYKYYVDYFNSSVM